MSESDARAEELKSKISELERGDPSAKAAAKPEGAAGLKADRRLSDVAGGERDVPAEDRPAYSMSSEEASGTAKHPLAENQEAAEEERNRAQAEEQLNPSSDTPAGDPGAHPLASETANEVDRPGRAHTLMADEESGTADSFGQRLARLERAAESGNREVRPATQPGLKTFVPEGPYDVERELRAQWPGIELGDHEFEASAGTEGAPADESPVDKE